MPIVRLLKEIFDEYCVFGGLLDIDSNDVGELANMILSITRWEIWKRRNINRFENVLVPIPITMYKIRFQIKQHIELIARTNKTATVQNILTLL